MLHTDSSLPEPHRITVIVADADPLARDAIKTILREDGRFVIAAEARDAIEAIELAIHYAPDLLLVEGSLPAPGSTEVLRRVRARRPDVRSVLLMRDDDDDVALTALRDGASGIVSKSLDAASLRAALVAVSSGHAALHPALTMQLIERLRATPEPGRGFRPIHGPLTNREWEILDYLTTGATTSQIADRLFLTEDTVYSHIKNLSRKLGVHSRSEAVAAARRLYETAVAAAA